MFRCFFFKRLVFHENEPSAFIFIYFFLSTGLKISTLYTETVGSLTSSGRDSLQVARQPRKSP